VPPADERGNTTRHPGRSTIASQLFNAKEPMTIFELHAGRNARAAVEEGVTAYESLLAKVTDVPTPSGQTPRQLHRCIVPVNAIVRARNTQADLR